MKSIAILFVSIFLASCLLFDGVKPESEWVKYETRKIPLVIHYTNEIEKYCRNSGYQYRKIIGCVREKVYLSARNRKEEIVNYGHIITHIYRYGYGPCFQACAIDGELHIDTISYGDQATWNIGDAVKKIKNINYRDTDLLGHEVLHLIYGPHGWEFKYIERMEESLNRINNTTR